MKLKLNLKVEDIGLRRIVTFLRLAPVAMASLLTHRVIRTSILKLPSELRSTALHHRPFSSTPSRKLTLLDIAIAGPNAVLDGIHSLGVPWYATLPLTAALVRGTFVYYVAILPARKQAQTRAYLLPLTNAKVQTIMGTKFFGEIEEMREATTPKLARAIEYSSMRFRATRMAVAETCKPYGAGMWSPRSLINFGMLVAFTEAIRLKCAAKEGLLPLLLSPFQWLAQKLDPERFPNPVEPESKGAAESMRGRVGPASSQSVEPAPEIPAQFVPNASRAGEIINGQELPPIQPGTTSKLEPLSGLDTTAHFDSSMMTEGLGWFTDLTLPDSSFMFPALLATTMLASVILRPSVGNATLLSKTSKPPQATSEDAEPTHTPPDALKRTIDTLSARWQTMPLSQRFGVWISGLFFLGALKMPVAILLYFIPSVGLGWFQSRWLDIKYPLPQPIEKCARPMRLKVRRQW